MNWLFSVSGLNVPRGFIGPLVPDDFIDPVKANKAISPNSKMGKNTQKSTINLCIKLSIAYICLLTIFTIYIVLVCTILDANNLFYKKIHGEIFYRGKLYTISYQITSDLSLYLIIPVSIVFGSSLIVINFLLIWFVGTLSSYEKNIKKISNIFVAGFFLIIPSYVACFILISKCKKLKIKNLQNKENNNI